MADNETTADIIAEMRLGSTGGMPFAYRIGRPDRNVEYKTEDGKKYEHRITVIEKVTIDELADRLEAAHNRETVTGSNQLREALKRIVAASIVAKNANAPEWILQRMADIFAMATTALAAPTRNCDRFATVDEARKAQGDCAMILEV